MHLVNPVPPACSHVCCCAPLLLARPLPFHSRSVSPRISEQWNLAVHLYGFKSFETVKISIYILMFIWEVWLMVGEG